jgi:hypothetical protein
MQPLYDVTSSQFVVHVQQQPSSSSARDKFQGPSRPIKVKKTAAPSFIGLKLRLKVRPRRTCLDAASLTLNYTVRWNFFRRRCCSRFSGLFSQNSGESCHFALCKIVEVHFITHRACIRWEMQLLLWAARVRWAAVSGRCRICYSVLQAQP